MKNCRLPLHLNYSEKSPSVILHSNLPNHLSRGPTYKSFIESYYDFIHQKAFLEFFFGLVHFLRNNNPFHLLFTYSTSNFLTLYAIINYSNYNLTQFIINSNSSLFLLN
jgi:hypothetical protein